MTKFESFKCCVLKFWLEIFDVQHFKISKSNFVFGPDFELLGLNKRVDLIFQESGRPDSRAKKSSIVPFFSALESGQPDS